MFMVSEAEVRPLLLLAPVVSVNTGLHRCSTALHAFNPYILCAVFIEDL
jgi:hypothetical protein